MTLFQAVQEKKLDFYFNFCFSSETVCTVFNDLQGQGVQKLVGKLAIMPKNFNPQFLP
jgi:hypothetical protein